MLKFSVTIFLVISTFWSYSQDIRLVASKSPIGVELKWFNSELISNEGVNLYYNNGDGQWHKINTQPIKKGNYIPNTKEISEDDELSKHLELVKSNKRLEGFALLLATMKSIKSTPFAKYLGMYYLYENVLINENWAFKVATLKNGKEHLESIIKLSDFENKIEVQNVSFEQKSKKVKFKWDPNIDKTFAYNIYRSNSPDSIGELITKEPIILSKVKNQKGIEEYPEWFYEDRLVKEKVSYYYSFVGIDFFYHQQQLSNPLLVRIKDETIPTAPKLLEKTETNVGFHLKWELSHLDEDVIVFNAFITSKNDTVFHQIENLEIEKEAREVDLILTEYGTYSVKIATKDDEGNFGFSNELILDYLDKLPPITPQNIRIVSDSNNLKLIWDKNEEIDLRGYRVYRGIDGVKGSMSLQNSTPFIKNEYIDLLPKNSKNHFTYALIAIDSNWNESELSNLVSEKLIDVVPPKSPFIKQIDIQPEGVLVIWIKNTEIDFKNYEIYRECISDSNKLLEKINLTELTNDVNSFFDRTLQKGKEYEYSLVAIDSIGNKSKPSNRYKVFIPIKKKEENLSCKIKQLKFSKSTRSVKIFWESNPYKDSVNYIVFRKENDGSFKPICELNSFTRYVDRNIENGKKYIYEVRCYYSEGKIAKSDQKEIEVQFKKEKE